MKDWKHINQRVEEHERSNMHRVCAEAYFLRASKADIASLLHGPQVVAHRHQVRKRRQVLERVVDIVKLIGKRGLSYRGTQFEAAYTLDDMSIDHGTFLELVILLGKYDVCMKEHLSECIEKSTRMHETHCKGRGSAVTFLSKTTVNLVISAVQHLIQEVIAKEVTEAGMFSVQIDTTQDITSQEQCSIVLRYVKDTVQERLLAVVKCEATTGQYFVQMLVDVMEKYKLEISNCISNATDGASNMQGQYRGFATLLSSKAPNQVHVWCYAHVLNLVLTDRTAVSISSGSLFSLLNDIAVFFRESYQRMNVWEQGSHDSRHRRLSMIGETRWWAKDVALKKIFGSFAKPQQCVYVDVLRTLEVIEAKENLKSSVRVKARGYLESLMRYETVLTAVTTPLSKYLQTRGLDILSAHRMVLTTEESLRNMARDFESVKQAADGFVQFANEKLTEEQCDLEVEEMLPEKRTRKKKMMAGEMVKVMRFSQMPAVPMKRMYITGSWTLLQRASTGAF
ncbi:Zinc finger MYM-type protein 1 [Merluccius polli]|uniref:Zinc finger MYM-type protein 1 n=1 Tax=Merluccius polli TaxID=89951 RepID=A0AA47MZB2_MERPO|nr:Zinc finger MYM-type protein 1 [Merluccius polli]